MKSNRNVPVTGKEISLLCIKAVTTQIVLCPTCESSQLVSKFINEMRWEWKNERKKEGRSCDRSLVDIFCFVRE